MKNTELLISTPSQVRALASGVRTAIVESLAVLGPSPVRALAARLGRSPESLYYHVRILERAGIIRLEQVRPAGRTKEAVYTLAAARLRLDRTKHSPAMRRARAAAAGAMLAGAARRARAAITAGTDEGDPALKRARVETLIVPLAPESLRELHERLDAVWEFLRQARAGAPGGGNAGMRDSVIALTIAVTPAPAGPRARASARTSR